MPDKLVRCAVYTRKSSEEGLEQSFNSLHAQREACEAYIVSQKHEGWVLVPTGYDDGGFSGGSMDRPAVQALMADVKAGLVNTVVVYKVDRLTRSLADFAKMVELFDQHQVSFVSVTQAFNTTTSMGRLTLNVLLSFAQFEREVTGERIRDKIAASKAKGMWMGGAVPLGYDVVDRQLIVNEPEAVQVRTLFQLYLEIEAVDQVVEEAHRLGIRSKLRGATGAMTGGTKLGRGALYRILANPVYAGEIGHKGQRYPGQHQGIVDLQVFAAAEAKLAGNRRKMKGKQPRNQTPLLSGLVVDGNGTRLVATTTYKERKRYRYYAGGPLRLPAEELDEIVVAALIERLADPTKLAPVLPSLELLDPELIDGAAKAAAQIGATKSAQRRALITAMVEQVIVTGSAVTISLRLAELGSAGVATITVSASIGRLRRRLALVIPGEHRANPDPALIGMVAQARAWFEMLASGAASSLRGVAAAEGVTPAYVRQHIGAAFLAPDLVTAIVEGRQPAALTATTLTDMLPLPSAWSEQRALIVALN